MEIVGKKLNCAVANCISACDLPVGLCDYAGFGIATVGRFCFACYKQCQARHELFRQAVPELFNWPGDVVGFTFRPMSCSVCFLVGHVSGHA
eukprot:scaffold88342_cov27-Prasinocladus_malaysianus.AAC.2